MKSKHLLLLLVASLINAMAGYGQFYRKDFGQVPEGEPEVPAFAASADAVCLFDRGKSRIEYIDIEGDWFVITERHMRILVLRKEGTEQGDFSISWYDSGQEEEKIYDLKAVSFNPSGDAWESSRLDRKDMYTEEVDEHWRKLKFAIPNVREGTILELCYTKKSPFLMNLDGWQFQKGIPVLESSYSIIIPQYFRYNVVEKGHVQHKRFAKESRPTSITITNSSREGRGVILTSMNTGVWNYEIADLEWEYENVPAFEPERYATATRNFLSAVEFELNSIGFPGQKEVVVSKTWADFDRELMEHPHFGARFETGNFLVEEIAGWKAANSVFGPEELLLILRNQVRCTGEGQGIFVNRPLKRCFDEGKANAEEMNMLYVEACRKAGFEAWPLILSTRSHGLIAPSSPKFSDFNKVISAVVVGTDTLLVDAGSEHAPFGVLPFPCLNQNFRVIFPDGGKWLHYEAPTSKEKKTITVSLDGEGNISGNGKLYLTNHYAMNALGNESPTMVITGGRPDDRLSFSEVEISQPEASDALKASFQLEAQGKAESVDGLLFFSPSLFDLQGENPFKASERLYPVDFGGPFEETEIVQINLPEGFEIRSVPEDQAVNLLGGKGYFVFQIQTIGDSQLQMVKKLIIKTPVFYAEEYQALKEFYEAYIQKEGEQIVLEKK